MRIVESMSLGKQSQNMNIVGNIEIPTEANGHSNQAKILGLVVTQNDLFIIKNLSNVTLSGLTKTNSIIFSGKTEKTSRDRGQKKTT